MNQIYFTEISWVKFFKIFANIPLGPGPKVRLPLTEQHQKEPWTVPLDIRQKVKEVKTPIDKLEEGNSKESEKKSIKPNATTADAGETNIENIQADVDSNLSTSLKDSPILKIFWERDDFKYVVNEDQLLWPTFVQHEKLILHKGRFPKVPQFSFKTLNDKYAESLGKENTPQDFTKRKDFKKLKGYKSFDVDALINDKKFLKKNQHQLPNNFTDSSTLSVVEIERHSSIGVIVAIIGNILISVSLNVQKLVHNNLKKGSLTKTLSKSISETDPLLINSQIYGNNTVEVELTTINQSPEEKAYYTVPLWWVGLSCMAIGELGNFSAYGFAPAILVTPLGTVALISNALIAPMFLNERLRRRDVIGILVAIFGTVTIVAVSSQTDEPSLTPDDIIIAIMQLKFLIYFLGTFLLGVILFRLSRSSFGQKYIFVDLSLVAICGGYTEVIPTNFVLFTTSTIIGSAVLYNDFSRMTTASSVSALSGISFMFFGVWLITGNKEEVIEYITGVDETAAEFLSNNLSPSHCGNSNQQTLSSNLHLSNTRRESKASILDNNHSSSYQKALFLTPYLRTSDSVSSSFEDIENAANIGRRSRSRTKSDINLKEPPPQSKLEGESQDKDSCYQKNFSGNLHMPQQELFNFDQFNYKNSSIFNFTGDHYGEPIIDEKFSTQPVEALKKLDEPHFDNYTNNSLNPSYFYSISSTNSDVAPEVDKDKSLPIITKNSKIGHLSVHQSFGKDFGSTINSVFHSVGTRELRKLELGQIERNIKTPSASPTKRKGAL
ncbi:hypothetical protein HK099_001294 [Clydaea vesicula]|uniref:Magnesium transporter n=1 Tax=Clydaea vesicula TaxID=447962 RepID=A0AAD5XZR4_9FUNG|nr:hypothetical protein HK099_001294 [Clydaea vesicula]